MRVGQGDVVTRMVPFGLYDPTKLLSGAGRRLLPPALTPAIGSPLAGPFLARTAALHHYAGICRANASFQTAFGNNQDSCASVPGEQAPLLTCQSLSCWVRGIEPKLVPALPVTGQQGLGYRYPYWYTFHSIS